MAEQKMSERRHPLFTEYLDDWEFFEESVKGGREYLEGGHLFSHRLESQDDDFQERKDRAYFLNFCDEVCETYTNYIMKEKIDRPEDSTLEEFRKDVDGRGTTIDEFMKKVSYLSSIYGHVHVVVDTPAIDEDKELTKRTEKEDKLRPYASIIIPTQLVDWSVDRSGNLNWILIQQEEFEDVDPKLERIEQITYKLITTEDWQVFDQDGNPADGGRSGSNDLGSIFLITCYHKDIDLDMVGESLIKDIAYVNRIIFNWSSCIDEMIERQTFSQLIVPDDGSLAQEEESGDPLKKISTSSVWTYPSDSTHAPNFISPNTDNLRVIWEMITAHIREIHRLAGLTGASEDLYTAQRSGTSQQYGFLNINSSLAAKATNLEKTENEINKLAYMWYNKDPQSVELVKYPTKFDVEALAQTMETSFLIVEREFSETLNKELLKKLGKKALPLASEEIRNKIDSEIESGDGTIAPLVTAGGFGGEEAGPGQPAKDVGSAAKNKSDGKEVKKSLQSNTKTSEGTKEGKPRK